MVYRSVILIGSGLYYASGPRNKIENFTQNENAIFFDGSRYLIDSTTIISKLKDKVDKDTIFHLEANSYKDENGVLHLELIKDVSEARKVFELILDLVDGPIQVHLYCNYARLALEQTDLPVGSVIAAHSDKSIRSSRLLNINTIKHILEFSKSEQDEVNGHSILNTIFYHLPLFAMQTLAVGIKVSESKNVISTINLQPAENLISSNQISAFLKNWIQEFLTTLQHNSSAGHAYYDLIRSDIANLEFNVFEINQYLLGQIIANELSRAYVTLDATHSFWNVLNQPNNFLVSPIHLVAFEGLVHTIRIFHHYGCNLDYQLEGTGNTALLVATQAGHLQTIQELISWGVNVALANNKGINALHTSIQIGRDDIAQFLIDSGAEVNSKTKQGYTPLFIAIQNEDLSSVLVLINAGVDLGVSIGGRTILYFALANIENEEIINILIDHYDLNKADQYGETSLFWAIQFNRVQAVSKIIKTQGIITTVNGVTALYFASFYGYGKIANVLLDAGLDPNDRNEDGKTALHIAAYSGHHDTLYVLIEAGADVNARGKDGETPVYLATQNNHSEALKILVNAGANPKTPITSGDTPLSYAKFKGYNIVIEYLEQFEVQNYYSDEGDFTTLFGLLSADNVIHMSKYGTYHGGSGADRFVLHLNYTGQKKGLVRIIDDFIGTEGDILDLSNYEYIRSEQDIELSEETYFGKGTLVVRNKINNEVLVILPGCKALEIVDNILVGSQLSQQEEL
jgi:ankyrin repeat protein